MTETRIRNSARSAEHATEAEGVRVPLSLFGMPLGLAGLAGAWAAAETIGAPLWPAEALYAASSVLWAVLVVLYLSSGFRTRGRAFHADLRHPQTGPFASVIPLVAILLAAHYTAYGPTVFGWICALAIVALAVVVAQLIAHWLSGAVDLRTIHPGYYIPSVAGPFIASIGLSTLGLHSLAIAAIGAGLFFWVAITAVVIVRMLTGDRVPDALRPGMAAFVAGAATANLAWLIAHPGGIDQAQELMTGVLVVMLMVQAALASEYRTLRFSLAWWIFTFPAASTSNYAIRWLSAVQIYGWRIYAWAVLLIATAFTLYIAARTVAGALSRILKRRTKSAPAEMLSTR